MSSFSMASLALRVKNRVVADPSIGLSDIQDVIKKCLEAAGDYDLLKYLATPPNLSWKTAACPDWLTRLQQLFTGLLKLAPNCCLAGKKVRGAIEKMCEPPSKVNFSKKSTADFVDMCDETIRIGMAQLRNLHGSELLRQRCFKKADGDQIAVLERMLAMIEVEDSQEVAAPANETPATSQALVSVPPVPPSWKQEGTSGMIPSTSQMPEPSAPAEAPINLIIDFDSAAAVFERIANKKRPESTPPSIELSPRRPAKAIAGTSPDDCLLQTGLKMVLPDLSVKDAAILADLDEQKPINDGHKSQLARMNASYFDDPCSSKGRGRGGRGRGGRGRGRGSKAGISP